MIKQIPLLLLSLMLFSGILKASEGDLKSFFFDGQMQERFELNSKKYETKYRTEEYDATCTRQIPYQEQVCGYETKYRTECRTIPGRQVCHNEPRQVCRRVTRQECRTVSDGQRCHNKQICQRLPGGGKRCRTQRVCTPKTRRVCRPVSKRVCHTEYQRVCHWEPSRRVCEQVPYQEYECHMETKYRTETYACTKTRQIPYQVFIGDVTARVDINFDESTVGQDLSSRIKFTAKLIQDEFSVTAINTNDSKSLIYIEKNISRDVDGKQIDIDATYNVKLISVEDALESFSQGISELEYNKDRVKFLVKRFDIPHDFALNLKLTRKTKTLGRTKTLFNRNLSINEFEVIELEEYFEIYVDLTKLNIKFSDGKRKYTLNTEFGINLRSNGTLTNRRDMPSNKTMSNKLKQKM